MAEKSHGQNGASTQPPAVPTGRKDAIRTALATLGRDAERTKIQSHIKQQFKMDMPLDHISNQASEIRREARTKGAVAKRPAETRPAAVKPAHKPVTQRAAARKVLAFKSIKQPVPVTVNNGKVSGTVAVHDVAIVKDPGWSARYDHAEAPR